MLQDDERNLKMDRKAQEIFFAKSVDMNAIMKHAKAAVDVGKKSGDPKRIRIEIRKVDEFNDGLSPEEIFEEIDKEFLKERYDVDMFRATLTDDCVVIVGVKL